jgi:hypothetical protein
MMKRMRTCNDLRRIQKATPLWVPEFDTVALLKAGIVTAVEHNQVEIYVPDLEHGTPRIVPRITAS